MRLEFSHIADVPNMVADACIIRNGVRKFVATDLLNKPDCFEHRNVCVSRTAHIIDFAWPRRLIKFPECRNEIAAVNVVTHLLSFITENSVRFALNCADDEIGKKTM